MDEDCLMCIRIHRGGSSEPPLQLCQQAILLGIPPVVPATPAHFVRKLSTERDIVHRPASKWNISWQPVRLRKSRKPSRAVKQAPQHCGWRAMKIKQPSSSSFSGWNWYLSTATDEFETLKAMSMNDVVAAVDSGDFDLVETTSKDFTPIFPVCLNDNLESSRCQHTENLASFIQTRNRKLSSRYDRQMTYKQQTKASSEQPRQQQQYQLGRNRRGGWSNYDWNPSFNRNNINSIIAIENANRDGTI